MFSGDFNMFVLGLVGSCKIEGALCKGLSKLSRIADVGNEKATMLHPDPFLQADSHTAESSYQ
jgi:hypothetical protein